MQVGKDLSTPSNDLLRESDGKYIYKIGDNKFEIDKFNRDFEQYKTRRYEEMKQKMQQKLNELNIPEPEIPVYNLPVGEILVNAKDESFDTLDDLLQFKFTTTTITKNNRLFYFGFIIILIGLLVLIYKLIFSNRNKPDYKITFSAE